MELFLNSAWAAVSVAVICLWLCFGRGAKGDRPRSFVTLIVLVAVLFPLISISDDLWQINNPAESDSSLRRDHSGSIPHSVFPTIAAPPEPINVGVRAGFQGLITLFHSPLLAFENPALHPLQNRPPPTT